MLAEKRRTVAELPGKDRIWSIQVLFLSLPMFLVLHVFSLAISNVTA